MRGTMRHHRAGPQRRLHHRRLRQDLLRRPAPEQLRDPECRQAIEHGISFGRGGMWLMLTAEQYGS
jgi:hypothetical protein